MLVYASLLIRNKIIQKKYIPIHKINAEGTIQV